MTFVQTIRRAAARPPRASRRRGIAAILAMMFLVIFASLAAAMAVVSQGNLRVADTNIKISRSLAAAETGMELMTDQLERVVNGDLGAFPGIRTEAGLIHDEALATTTPYSAPGNASRLWGGDPADPTSADPATTILGAMIEALTAASHYEPTAADPAPRPRIVALEMDELFRPTFGNRVIKQLHIPNIRFGPDSPLFEVRMTPHPLPMDLQPSEAAYDDPYYDRMPFGVPTTLGEEIAKREMGIDFIVGNADPDPTVDPVIQPLDARFVRVTVTAIDDGGDPDGGSAVSRSISRDFRIDKTIPYAILSNSRLMLGQNVSVRGNVASRFSDQGKTNGHPVQIQSDFLGLHPDLDDGLDEFFEALRDPDKDIDGDNRLNLQNIDERDAAPVSAVDHDLDGYITEFDYLLGQFRSGDNLFVGRQEFIDQVASESRDERTAEQLFDLLDTAGDRRRAGHGDAVLDANDLVSKIQGSVSTLIDEDEWQDGYELWRESDAGPRFKSDLQGTVNAGFGNPAQRFGDERLLVYDIDQTNFDTSVHAQIALNNGDRLDLSEGAGGYPTHGPGPKEYVAPSDATLEDTPFGSANAYDRYFRPVYRNMVFEDLFIPKGSNPLFENCRFIGVTYIEVEEFNDNPDFNRSGMIEPGSTFASPVFKWDIDIDVNGTTVENTKTISNNLRFHDCVFEGAIASGTASGGQPLAYTHVRNKVTFTGRTRFDHDAEDDPERRRFYERSSLLLPHISVEVGSFQDGYSSAENVELTGAIVAGVIDMRGQVTIQGTLISTFEPVDGVAPVEDGNTPNFNVTLGYFSQDLGDLEAAVGARTEEGLGRISIVYDPSLALPDGIDSPIEMRPLPGTYFEGGR